MDEVIIVRNAVDKSLCDFLSLEFQMMETVFHNLYPGHRFEDMCSNSFARYAPLMFEALSVKIMPLIESTVNKKLLPTYSYARIYYQGSELKRHKDRASSEVTVSICIEKDQTNWPLYVQINDITHEINLEVGDLAIYSGRVYDHWRTPFIGNKQVQAFLQYVDAEGSSSELKWDTRPCLGMPFEWASAETQSALTKSKN